MSGVTIPEKSILEFKAIFQEWWHRAPGTRQGK
jgi:hypothetical protein